MAEFLLHDVVLPVLNKTLAELVNAGALELYDRRGKGATLLARLRFADPSAGEALEDSVKFHDLHPEVDAPARGRVRWAVGMAAGGARVFECDAGDAKDKPKPVVVLDDAEIRPGDIVRVKEFTLVLRQAVAK